MSKIEKQLLTALGTLFLAGLGALGINRRVDKLEDTIEKKADKTNGLDGKVDKPRCDALHENINGRFDRQDTTLTRLEDKVDEVKSILMAAARGDKP